MRWCPRCGMEMRVRASAYRCLDERCPETLPASGHGVSPWEGADVARRLWASKDRAERQVDSLTRRGALVGRAEIALWQARIADADSLVELGDLIHELRCEAELAGR